MGSGVIARVICKIQRQKCGNFKKASWIEIASIIILTFSLGLYQTDCRLLNGIKLVDVWLT